MRVKIGLADAPLAASFRPGVVGRQTIQHRPELALKPPSLSHLLVHLADPPGQEHTQAGLQRPALARRSCRNQIGDVFQAHPDALGPGDEGHLFQSRLIEEPVAVGCPPGR